MTLLPLGLAVVAAILNASGDLLQRRATRDEPDQATGGARMLLDLARHPAWLGGVVASLVGLCVHVVALSLGELATVQPLLVLEMPLAVLGMSRLFGVSLSRRDWVAVGLLTLGLAAFVVFLSPTGGDPTQVSGVQWAVGLGILAVVGAAAALVGLYSGRDLRAGLLGLAAGVGYGAAAVLFSAAGSAASGGITAIATTWQTYAAIVVALFSFYLLQNSLNSGLLVATEPGLTLANPIVAVTWGLLLFGEQARTGAWLIGSVAGGVLLVAGTLLLSRSPVLDAHASGDPEEPSSPVRSRGDASHDDPARTPR
ncbi:DMT family transporter [Actinomycetospora flava]|uniref:DMT family transporter n=1 Tax=Actinomycetospora flava TaxID=3129232 RepID=A0ABU8M8B3_9PSEU